jgi:hypothetical protein
MNIQQRLEKLPLQERTYTIGTVESIHDQWVFFDEHDEPTALADITKECYQININDNWVTFHKFDDGMALGPQTYTIKHGDTLRIKKPLSYVYQEWLNELTDEAFGRIVQTLNNLQFSVFDCIYCHNFLFFKIDNKPFNGVNFLLFDNGEQICALQHHFERSHQHTDRFEVTLNTGKRQLLTNIPG